MTRHDHPVKPHPLVAIIPVVVLIGFLSVIIMLFGSDSLNGGSQIALLLGMAVCVCLSMAVYRVPWDTFEQQIKKTLGGVSATLLILLCVGMLSGSWMISGIVPTLIYYGVQIMSPQFFLVSSCIICAFISLLSGSSWTTIATIGVALLGIGHALGISEAWTAGAIISGAYFGDKMSPLSDTTILASSAAGVDLFTHIRYMMYTTGPTFLITTVIFLVAGLDGDMEAVAHVGEYTDGLSHTFNISLWTNAGFSGVLNARTGHHVLWFDGNRHGQCFAERTDIDQRNGWHAEHYLADTLCHVLRRLARGQRHDRQHYGRHYPLGAQSRQPGQLVGSNGHFPEYHHWRPVHFYRSEC